MKSLFFTFLLLIVSINLIAVPNSINFQGALKDLDGIPVNDTQFMEFRIYDDGNNLVWSEQHLAVEIEDGIFSEELGISNQFPPSLFETEGLFITFLYGGEEMTPKQKLHSVPYALKAENTNKIQDVPLSWLVQQDTGGNATLTGTMTASDFVGDGSGLTNLGSFDDLYVNTAGPDTISASPSSDEGVLNINHQGTQGYGIEINSDSYLDAGISMSNLSGDGVYLSNLSGYAYRAISGYSHFRSHSSQNYGLEVYSSGSHGITMSGIGGDGIHIESATGDLFQGGLDGSEVFIVSNNGKTDITSTPDSSEGVLNINHQGTQGYGIEINSDSYLDAGISMSNLSGDGVYLSNLSGYAYRAIGGYSHFRSHSSQNYGLEVYSSGSHGITMSGIGGDGVNIGSSAGDGVYANTTDISNEWGFNTPDKINGSNITTRSQSTHVRNTGSEALETGDIVCIAGGYEDNVLGEGDFVSLVNVEKANSRNSGAVLGVVEYKVAIREEADERNEGKTLKSFRHADGRISSGDYLSVIVFGPADVKADGRSNIKSGEKLTVSDNSGKTRSINESDNWTIGILGKSLEDSNGKDTVKVFVNCK